MHKQNFSIQSTNHEEDKQMKVTIKTPRTLAAVVAAFCTSTLAFSQHIIQSNPGDILDNFGAGNNSMINNTIYGRMGLIGAINHDVGTATNPGAAFLYKYLETASGVVIQNHTLLGDEVDLENFGKNALTNGGDLAVVTAQGNSHSSLTDPGAAFIFKNLLNPALATVVTYSAKLITSDAKDSDYFGLAVAAENDVAVISAQNGTNAWSNSFSSGVSSTAGSAYVYRDLSTRVGTTTENIKLQASDLDYDVSMFGHSVAYRNNTALVGAPQASTFNIAIPDMIGAAYLYRNLDTWASATKYEDVKLVFPILDGENENHGFGSSVTLNESATIAAVGARGYDTVTNDTGIVFVYKDLTTIDSVNPVTGVNEILPDVALRASDAAANTFFGLSVSMSGDTLLVGAQYADEGGLNPDGAIYFFDRISTLNSGITNIIQSLDDQGATVFKENARVWITNPGVAPQLFGTDVRLDGNGFLASAPWGDGANFVSGTAYTGDKRVFLGLDTGSTALSTNGLSFWSRQDWIIGDTTDFNHITINPGDSAFIRAVDGIQTIIGNNASNNTLVASYLFTYDLRIGVNGNNNQFISSWILDVINTPDEDGNPTAPKNVTIGENPGADNNLLHILTTSNAVVSGTTTVGAAGNTGNTLRVDGSYVGFGDITITSNAKLSGTGAVIGMDRLDIYGKHSPNDDGAVGVQQVVGEFYTMRSGSTLHWDLIGNTTTGRGINYDGIDTPGIYGLTIETGANIYLSFDAPGSTVDWTNTFWDVDYLGTSGWLIYDLASGPLVGMSNFNLLQSPDSLGAMLGTLRPGAYFELFQSGNDVYLNYLSAPLIPEAQTSLLIVMTLLGLLALHRKLKKSGAHA